ncbi:MAG: hypothetical protein ACLTV0_10010 [Faecalimonas sp.]
MEEIKMYGLRWRGQVEVQVSEVARVLENIVKTSIEMHGDSDYTSYSVSAYCVDEIEVSIVAISKKRGMRDKRMVERQNRNRNGNERDTGIPPPF